MGNKEKLSFLDKLTRSMVWFMLFSIVSSSVLPAASAVVQASEIESTSVTGSEPSTEQSVVEPEKSSDAKDNKSKVQDETVDAAPEKNNEAQPNAPNGNDAEVVNEGKAETEDKVEEKEAEVVKAPKSRKGLSKEANARIEQEIRKYAKSNSYSKEKVDEVLNSEEYAEAQGVTDKLMLFDDMLLFLSVKKSLMNGEYSTDMEAAEFENVDKDMDLGRQGQDLEFAALSFTEGHRIEMNNDTYSFEEGKQLIEYTINVYNKGKQDLVVSPEMFVAQTSTGVYDTTLAVGMSKNNEFVGMTNSEPVVIGANGMTEVKVPFLVDAGTKINSLHFELKDKALVIDLGESVIEKFASFIGSTKVDAAERGNVGYTHQLADDGITHTDKNGNPTPVAGVWKLVDHADGTMIYCIEPGAPAFPNMPGKWVDATEILSRGQVQEIIIKKEILEALGYTPGNIDGGKGTLGTVALQLIVWQIVGAQVKSDNTVHKILMGQAKYLFDYLKMSPSFDNINVASGFTMGKDGEFGTSGIAFDGPESGKLRVGDTMRVLDFMTDAMNHRRHEIKGDVKDNKYGEGTYNAAKEFGVAAYVRDISSGKIEGPEYARMVDQVINGVTPGQATEIVHLFNRRRDVTQVMVPWGKGLGDVTDEELAWSKKIFDLNPKAGEFEAEIQVKVKDPKALAQSGIKDWKLIVASVTVDDYRAGAAELYKADIFLPDEKSHQKMTKIEGRPFYAWGSPKIEVVGQFSIDSEKSIVDPKDKVMSTKDAQDAGVKFETTKIGLFKDGKPVKWEDNQDVTISKGKFVDQGKGNIEFFADKDGKFTIHGVLWGEYELRELTQPDGANKGPKDKFTVNPDKDAKGSDAQGLPLVTVKNGADLGNSKALVNSLKTFGFEASKIVTMTGSKQPVKTPVAQDSEFSDKAHKEIIKEKVDLSKATFELQHVDGKPVKWTDSTMKLFKDADVTVGKVDRSKENVRFNPTKDGKLEVHNLIAATNKFKLVEVTTPDRTNLDSLEFTINMDAPTYGKAPYKYENFDKGKDGNNKYKNNIDYTGIKLVKQGDYLGTKYGTKGEAFDAKKDTLGQAKFDGAEYTLYYGNGPKADQPVMNGDYVVEKMTASAETSHSTTGPVVFTVKNNGLVAIVDNIVFGSYYLMETKAAPGHHLDTTRFYFGDKPEKVTGGKYLEPKVTNANDKGIGATNSGHKDISAAKESEGVTTDAVKLISNRLEKRTKYLGTESPFQTGKRGAWGTNAGSGIVYSHGDVETSYIHDGQLYGDAKVNDLGTTRRAEAVYGLFYAANTLDGQGKKGQPVKWNDRVVEHMTIESGRKVDKKYTTVAGQEINGETNVTLKLSDKKEDYAQLAVANVAHGTYYWKELEAPMGLAIDHKEYIWGNDVVDRPTYEKSDKLKSDLNKQETQTNTTVSKNDDKANYHFNNTFKDGKPHGSTDTIVTFGFSGSKLAQYIDQDAANDGENGVELTLTPYGDTLGDPIKTKSHKAYVKTNDGKVKNVDGYYEFRTVPIGTYYMTSNGEGADTSGNPASLAEMTPIFVQLTRDDKGGYELAFYLDRDEDGELTDDDLLLSEYSYTEGFMPDQAGLDAVAVGHDEIRDGYGKGKNGADVYEGEDYVWTREDNKDVNSDGSKNNNFISAEINLDYAGFDINDNEIKPDALVIDSKATNANDGSKVLPANQKEVTIVDEIIIENDGRLKDGDKFTMEAQPMIKSTGQPHGKPTYKTFTYSGQKSVDVEVNVSTHGLNNEEIVMFQVMYEGEVNDDSGLMIAAHMDIDAESQTLRVEHNGSIGTKATDGVDGDKFITSDENQKIRDDIDLTNANLSPGKVYEITKPVPTLPYKEGLASNEPVEFKDLQVPVTEMTNVIDEKGNLAVAVPYLSAKVIRENDTHEVEIDGKTETIVLADNEFVYEEGMKEVSIMVSGIDMSGYRSGQNVVMFEEIDGEDINPLIHADINDKNQTVTTQPSLQTLFQTGTTPEGLIKDAAKEDVKLDKFYTPGKRTESVDYVTFRGVTPGVEQTIEGKLMVPADNEDGYAPYLDLYGNEVTGSITFTPNTTNGIVAIYFDFVANKEHTPIVAFERGTYTGEDKPYATHEDINDKGQTIEPRVPEIVTKATVDGQKTFTAAKDTPMKDVAEVSGLIEGDNYTATIKLWRIENGDVKNAKVVFETDKDFIAEAENEEQVIETLVDTSQDKGQVDYVWTEELKDGDEPHEVLHSHHDLNNKEQTVSLAEKPEKPAKPEKPFAKTGTAKSIFTVVLGLMVIGLGYVYYTRQNKQAK